MNNEQLVISNYGKMFIPLLLITHYSLLIAFLYPLNFTIYGNVYQLLLYPVIHGDLSAVSNDIKVDVAHAL